MSKEPLVDRALIESQVKRVLPNPASCQVPLCQVLRSLQVGCVRCLSYCRRPVKGFFVAHEHGYVHLTARGL
jgi:hypothetical protein